MKETIFTKIVKREIPSSVVYEDDTFISFLDISPNNLGHTLLIPKEPFERLKDIPDEILQKMWPLAKRISMAIEKATDCEGLNYSVNDGEVAGQEVPHFHLHLIPRFKGDEFKHGRHLKYESDEEKEKMAESIRKGLL